MKVKRWAAGLFVTCYLLWLTVGVVGHALKIPLVGNTLGYFIVWDMFCGWSAYDNRTRLIAEDSQGNYFEVREPWGAFTPFGNVDRVNYDVSSNLTPRHIKNVIAHTQHPDIDRVYVVQEIWPKQFNVPDRLWTRYFHEPKDTMTYYSLFAICRADGSTIESYPDWFNVQTMRGIADNPRLQQAAQMATPLYNTFFNPRTAANSAGFQNPTDLSTN